MYEKMVCVCMRKWCVRVCLGVFLLSTDIFPLSLSLSFIPHIFCIQVYLIHAIIQSVNRLAN